MLATMYDAPGIGLAAPQIGISRRLIVMDPPHATRSRNSQLIMDDPVILERVRRDAHFTRRAACRSRKSPPRSSGPTQ